MKIKPKGYWTKESCAKEALKYKKRTLFREKSGSVYTIAYKNGWLDEICLHMKVIIGYWTKEKCHEVALKCKFRNEFRKKF